MVDPEGNLPNITALVRFPAIGGNNQAIGYCESLPGPAGGSVEEN
jgi:hypothetical protein